jgi:hypothetical protein
MSNEIVHRGDTTGSTVKYTIRNGTRQYWNTNTTTAPAFETLDPTHWYNATITNDNYCIDMAEAPASSYLYVGAWPATLTTVGWYTVDIYAGTAISSPLIGTQYGYWDGTNFHLDAANVKEVASVTQTGGDIITAIGSIGSGTGAALNFAPDDDNVDGDITSAPTFSPAAPFVGVQTSGTFASASADDGTYHQIDDATNEIDIIYQFNVGAGRNCAKIVFTGYMGTGTSDTCVIKAYNFITTAWDTRSTLVGQTGSVDKVQDVTLLSAHTGTGTHAGKVYLRFDSTATNQVLYVDSLIAQAQNLGQTVGYADGSIWVDTVGGVAGTTPYVNGTADNPVLTWADAKTLAASTGLTSFHFLPNSSIALDASVAGYRFIGTATIALANQIITHATFRDCYTISGDSTGDDATFTNCGIGTAKFDHCYFIDCRFKGVVTFLTNKDYFVIRGSDTTPSANDSATFIFAANTTCVFRSWDGGIILKGMSGTANAIINGSGRLTIDATSTAGSITLRGDFPPATGATANAFGTSGVIVQTQRYGTDVVIADTAGTTTMLADYSTFNPDATTDMRLKSLHVISNDDHAVRFESQSAGCHGLYTYASATSGIGCGNKNETASDNDACGQYNLASSATGTGAGNRNESVSSDILYSCGQYNIGSANGQYNRSDVGCGQYNKGGAADISLFSGSLVDRSGSLIAVNVDATLGWGGSALPTIGTSTLAASDILVTPANKLATDSSGNVAANNLPADYLSVAQAASLAAIEADTNELQGEWADGGRLDLILDTAAVKTGYSLAATGLDSITATRPTGKATTFPAMLVQLFYRFFGKADKDTSTNTIKTYAANGTTVVTTQTISETATKETQGEAT